MDEGLYTVAEAAAARGVSFCLETDKAASKRKRK